MTLTVDLENHINICLTSIFKVKRQGQVIYFGLFEIADLENVEIDTKIEPVACIQPEIKKGHVAVRLTSIFKVNRQSHVINFGLFEIPDLDNVEINTKIRSVACIQPEIEEVT